MQEFFVANNRVDILRNQIVREGQVIALEPKVLEVLRVLAEHQGKVVSHQTLLDSVWPDIVVAPNALQRCIGQLRKALNDDGKTQRVIATHPKRGYSLLAPVTVRSAVPDNIANSQTALTTPVNKRIVWLAIPFFAVIFYLVVKLIEEDTTSAKQSHPLQKFNRLSPLTATDASEFYSTFSPDGRYVAFSRKVSGQSSHMWVLDRESGKEVRFTDKPGNYGKPAWSTDGKQLAFLEITQCQGKCQFNPCVDINLVFTPLAFAEPQPSKKLKTCLNIPYLGLEWIDEQHLAAIVESDLETDAAIITINSQTADSEILFEARDTKLYSLSYSPARSSLAVMQVKPQKQPSLFLLSTKDGSVEEQVFIPPKRYNSAIRWYPVWDHTGENLLFSASSRLYMMDLNGTLHSQMIPTFEEISYPMFHPSGNSIAMTLGKVDTDVAELLLTESEETEAQKTEDQEPQYQKSFQETPFARSILRESHAQYQPNGDKIAFFSKRSGTRQIWLTDSIHSSEQSETFQLSHIEDVFPEHFVWSPGGQQIAVGTEHQVMLIDLQGEMEVLDAPFRVSRLYQWLPGDELLMQIVDDEEHKLIRYRIATNRFSAIASAQSLWAQSNEEITWFIDNQRQLKQTHNGSTQLLDTTSHIKVGARFFLRGQQLFILASNDDVWRYNLTTSEISRLFHYPNSTVHLTDVSHNGQRMLISKQLSAKKEIVLLTP